MNRIQWYGLKVGDRINFLTHTGIVISLSPTDNNRGMMETKTGMTHLISCKHCEIIDEANPEFKPYRYEKRELAL